MLALLVALAGCGEIPQPFRHEGAPTNLARPKMVRGVTLRLEPGQLAESMVKAFEAHEIPAATAQGPAFGHILEASVSRRGDRMAVDWLLVAPDGSPAARHQHSMSTRAWEAGDFKHLAADAVEALSEPLADPDLKPLADAPPPRRRETVRVVPFKSLPGDGNKALTASIKRALDRAGMAVVEEGGDYVVEGNLTIAPGLPNQETVTLVWLLRRADGNELAAIDQGGAVPRGRLALPWGALAHDMAEGGAAGMAEAIEADVKAASKRQ